MRRFPLVLVLALVAAIADPNVGTGTAGLRSGGVVAILGAQSAAPPPSSEWLAGVRAEALARGIAPAVVEAALGNLPEPLPSVIERDRAQAEVVETLEQYIARRASRRTAAAGRTHLIRHRALLAKVSRRYGVPAPLLVSIWGIESNYGRFSGVRPTVAALATLAWDPRRAAFFRNELFSALEIVNRGDIELAKMRGSWAGAMGQVQFMPSSYLQYAEDFDGDGRRDIWGTPADVFASIANYLRGHGWVAGERWGREVRVSNAAATRIAADVPRRDGTCQAARDMTIRLPLARWTDLGVTLPGGERLPSSTLEAALVSGSRRHFLVYRNYDALLEYNCAHAYALAVGLLGDAVAAAP
ncbi:MAG: lytic murein transglycosylase [Acidobacteria bacterium]|nr:lytic murein transglycosylase [Acidobacteriota bacterium]